MREKLAGREGQWGVYTGIMTQYGSMYGSEKLTVLLKNIKDSKGNFICDHVWLEATKHIRTANLMFGDKIQFTAIVRPYYTDHGYDFGFVCVSNIVKIGKVQTMPATA